MPHHVLSEWKRERDVVDFDQCVLFFCRLPALCNILLDRHTHTLTHASIHKQKNEGKQKKYNSIHSHILDNLN